MIAVVDYGMGNLRSVHKALETVGLRAVVTKSAKKIDDASHVVLPGVGAFGDCMKNLKERGLVAPILRSIEKGKPYLGICLGLQVLLEMSHEFGRRKGLGLVNGHVRRFPPGMRNGGGEVLKVPHMGWNRIDIGHRNPLFKGIRTGSFFYFVHSFYADCEDKSDIAASCTYGVEFTASVRKNNVFACQFHPEKSQELGLKILANFGGLS